MRVWAAVLVGSGTDFDLDSDLNESPNFLDFRVGDRDTTFRPVVLPVQFAEVGVGVRQAVDHDVAAGRYSQLACTKTVLLVGVRDMESLMEATVGILAVDAINTLGSAMITLTSFGSDWLATEGHFVRLELFAAAVERECALGFEDEDTVSGA